MYGKKDVVEGLHHGNDEFAPWEPDDPEYRKSNVARKLHYRLYEVLVHATADLDTGDYMVKHFEYNGIKYVPERGRPASWDKEPW